MPRSFAVSGAQGIGFRDLRNSARAYRAPGRQHATASQRMKDLYVIVVALIVVVHFAFLGYVVIGGFLALRWRWTIWLHVPAVVWGVGIVTFRYDCPLTWLEQWARAKAGMQPLPSAGFIDYYITGVLYPSTYVGLVEVVVFSIVVSSWIAIGVATRRVARGPRDSPDISVK
jgi:hypothetical protein